MSRHLMSSVARCIVFSLCIASTVAFASRPAFGDDCNQNGIDDAEDIASGQELRSRPAACRGTIKKP